eukprot:7502694-Pyramimonas_sp.AAC.2
MSMSCFRECKWLPTPVDMIRKARCHTCSETQSVILLTNLGLYRAMWTGGRYQMVLLGFSRISAYSMFLPILLVVVSKCKFLVETVNRIQWCNVLFADALSLEGHEIHVLMGNFIGVASAIHAVAHFLRWLDQVCDERTNLTPTLRNLYTP